MPPRPPLDDSHRHRRARRRLLLWLSYWILIFVATHVPTVPGLAAPRFTDKVVHFGLYAVLTILGSRWYSASVRKPSLRGLIGWATIYVAYAAFDEWLQGYTLRSPSLADFLADAAGITIATLWLVLEHRRRPKIRPSPTDPVTPEL